MYFVFLVDSQRENDDDDTLVPIMPEIERPVLDDTDIVTDNIGTIGIDDSLDDDFLLSRSRKHRKSRVAVLSDDTDGSDNDE